jgi:hypothetical protein
MMTVLYRPMRPRRWMRIQAGIAPPSWAPLMRDKTIAGGSAKPGRGGRRKRRRRAAGERALTLGLQFWDATEPRMETWPLLLRAERLLPDPPLHVERGRRERRRRAKLRRRRDAAKYRREARAFLLERPWCWRMANRWTRVVTLARRLHAYDRQQSPTPGI